MRKIDFKKTIWDFYDKNKRDFPWRNTTDPYKILVSEVMLQQTQTSRVIPKYLEFLSHFPNISALLKASQPEVLKVWQGLGYNRRALYLKRTAEILAEYNLRTKGGLFLNPEFLQTLPGIGLNTAGAIYVFSTNNPYVFIETNIRRVFIHHFFKDQIEVADKEILKLIEKTLDQKNPREYYYALMDYGAYLANAIENPNRKSKHYLKQSQFKGSIRQTRGAILKKLLEGSKSISDLRDNTNSPHFENALAQLEKEGFLEQNENMVNIKS